MSRPVMYIFVNRGLGMTSGKLMAQASHAAIQAYQLSKPTVIKEWMLGKHYTKLVMLAKDEQDIQNIQDYLESRGFRTEMIIDEGRNEIDPITKTALGVEIVDKDGPHVEATFSSFELYEDVVRATLEFKR